MNDQPRQEQQAPLPTPATDQEAYKFLENAPTFLRMYREQRRNYSLQEAWETIKATMARSVEYKYK